MTAPHAAPVLALPPEAIGTADPTPTGHVAPNVGDVAEAREIRHGWAAQERLNELMPPLGDLAARIKGMEEETYTAAEAAVLGHPRMVVPRGAIKHYAAHIEDHVQKLSNVLHDPSLSEDPQYGRPAKLEAIGLAQEAGADAMTRNVESELDLVLADRQFAASAPWEPRDADGAAKITARMAAYRVWTTPAVIEDVRNLIETGDHTTLRWVLPILERSVESPRPWENDFLPALELVTQLGRRALALHDIPRRVAQEKTEAMRTQWRAVRAGVRQHGPGALDLYHRSGALSAFDYAPKMRGSQ